MVIVTFLIPWARNKSQINNCLTVQLFTDYMAYGGLKSAGKRLEIQGNLRKVLFHNFMISFCLKIHGKGPFKDEEK